MTSTRAFATLLGLDGDGNYVVNEDIAMKIADILLKEKYGSDYEPLLSTEYIAEKEMWVVKSASDIPEEIQYVLLKKRTGEVIAIGEGNPKETLDIFSNELIMSEECAEKIAIVLWSSFFGTDKIEFEIVAEYDEIKDAFLVTNILPDNTDGGRMAIIIRKSNAEVIGFWWEM
jgi:hypothetical protein